MRAPLRIAALFALAAVVALAGCGGDSAPGEEGETDALILADSGPTGLPSLVKGDAKSGPQNQRLPITRDGVPVAIYALKVDKLEDGVRVGAIGTVTLTKCAITDYMPNARSFTACEGTKVYDYDPVTVETTVRLVRGDKSPDLSDRGTLVADPTTTKCTTAIHHCTISEAGEIELSSSDVEGDTGWVVFEATASSPDAATCTSSSTPKECNVLAVETQKGTAMYAARVTGRPSDPNSLPEDTSVNTRNLKVLIDRGDKNDVRQVIYSVELAPQSGLEGLKNDQLVVQAMIEASEKLPAAPDIANYLVLTDSPNGIRGRYLISDSYDSGKTGNNGENCDSECSFIRPAAVTRILECDIEAGRRYVNVVAAASRARAKKGETVALGDEGYLKVTKFYDGENQADFPSTGTCDR